MSYRHDDIIDEDDEIHTRPREREVTLSTGTILGLFVGLALLCGAFWGLGYNMGSKARPETVAASETTPPATADFNKFKPAPGAPAIQPIPGYMSQKEADASNKAAYNAAYKAASNAGTTPTVVTPSAPAPAHANEAVVSAAPVVRTPPPPAPHPAGEGTGNFVVQVAAVSHQEDADLLDNALRRKGYSVNVRTEPQDKLFHIQVGPFLTKKDAEVMRQRLLTDGYNAIVK